MVHDWGWRQGLTGTREGGASRSVPLVVWVEVGGRVGGEGGVCRLRPGQGLRLAGLPLPGARLLLAVPVLRDPDPLADRHPLVPPLHLVDLVDVDLRRAWRYRVAWGSVVVRGWQAAGREKVIVSRVVIVPTSSSTTMNSRLSGRHWLRFDLQVAWACSLRRGGARDGEVRDAGRRKALMRMMQV